MKKKLLLVGLLGMLSTGAFAFSGEFTTQMESYTYNTGADENQESNSYIPQAALKLKPISGSSFYVGGAYSARTMSNTDKRSVDQRRRTDLYVGQDFKFGDFTYSPKFQFRDESYRAQSDGTSKDFKEYRFYNGMKYKVNDEVEVFLSGYSALRRQDDDQRTGGADVTETYNDYHHEYELGAKYKVNDSGTATVSVYNEVIGQREVKTTSETQLRFVYKQQISDKVSVSPFIRIGLEKTDHKSGVVADTGVRHRFGVNGDYQVSPTFKLFAGVYAQPRNKHREALSGDTTVSANKAQTQVEYYARVGFTQKF